MGEKPAATSVAGRYDIVGVLGSGGMADVLLADDRTMARRVALKRSHPAAASRRALLREARIAGRLDHPGVVRVLGLVRDGEHDHLVLEHVAGTSLAEAARPDVTTLGRIARDLAAALAHVHGRGVLHLDLKHENVMLGAAGAPVLIDFGIARCDGEPDLVLDGAKLVGTPRAMAPEQILGHEIDARADLFALGGLLYELATGRSPFDAFTAPETLHNVLHHTPVPAARLAGGLPARLADMIDHLLEKDPTMRPQSAAEVVARLA
jgi:serine/threonine protein kinase